MKTKHTPGPWKFGSVITAGNCVGIAQMIDNPEWPNGEVEANSHRIVACVNACEGIEDPAALIESTKGAMVLAGSKGEQAHALRLIRAYFRDAAKTSPRHFAGYVELCEKALARCEEMDAALARAEGRK